VGQAGGLKSRMRKLGRPKAKMFWVTTMVTENIYGAEKTTIFFLICEFQSLCYNQSFSENGPPVQFTRSLFKMRGLSFPQATHLPGQMSSFSSTTFSLKVNFGD